MQADTCRCPKNFCSKFAGSIGPVLPLPTFWLYIAKEILIIFNKRPNSQTNKENNNPGHVQSDILINCYRWSLTLFGCDRDIHNLSDNEKKGIGINICKHLKMVLYSQIKNIIRYNSVLLIKIFILAIGMEHLLRFSAWVVYDSCLEMAISHSIPGVRSQLVKQ